MGFADGTSDFTDEATARVAAVAKEHPLATWSRNIICELLCFELVALPEISRGKMLGHSGDLDSIKANFPQIQLKHILGTWTIHLTTLRLWLKGDKRAPTLTYGERAECNMVHDTVEYRDDQGKTFKIVGHNTQDPNLSAHLKWRGCGWLFLITCKWYFLYMDAEDDVALIYFSKTLFTQEGIDVISRRPRGAVPEEALRKAIAHVERVWGEPIKCLTSQLQPLLQ